MVRNESSFLGATFLRIDSSQISHESNKLQENDLHCHKIRFMDFPSLLEIWVKYCPANGVQKDWSLERRATQKGPGKFEEHRESNYP